MAETPRPHLLLVVNNAPEAVLAEARRIFDTHPELQRSFAGFSAVSAGLRGDKDIYERDPHSPKGAYGARAGPNFLFLSTLREAAPFSGFTLQVELDCLPVQAGWIEATQRVIDRHPSAWVIGSIYAGSDALHPDIQSHMNGNAIYRTGSARFQAFLSEVWLPRLIRHSATRRYLAYDCWWSLERYLAGPTEENGAWQEAWTIFQAYDCFFQNDPFMVNLLVSEAQVEDYRTVFDKFTMLGRMPVFFHGQPMNTLREQLLHHTDDSILDGIARLSGAPPANSPVLQLARAPEVDPSVTPENAHGWLERLAQRIDTQDAGNAAMLLNVLSAQALLMPADLSRRLTPGSRLGSSAAQAKAALGTSHDAVRHFDSVLALIKGEQDATAVALHSGDRNQADGRRHDVHLAT